MNLLFTVARAVHGLIPDGAARRILTAAAYRLLYAGRIADYRYAGGVFTLKTRDGVEIKSVREFDPSPIIEDFQNVRVPRGATVADLGGNLGVAAVYLSRMVGPKGRVIVFEPDPLNFGLLERNIALNGCRNVTAIPRGVWGKECTLRFFSGGNYTSSFHATDYVERDKGRYSVRKVPVTTLDAALRRLKVKKLSLVKMDIEGSEVQALKGARTTLRKLKPDWIIEIHRIGRKSTEEAVLRLLNDAGYARTAVSGPRKSPTVTAFFI